jgi:hypothetical protein
MKTKFKEAEMDAIHGEGWERQSHVLLDYLIKSNKLKNDAALAIEMGVKAPIISKYRNKKLKVGAPFILLVHELFDIEIKEIRRMLAEDGQHGYR